MNKTFGMRPQGGATLIEVMVAVLVLSIGMLGIAGLVSASMRYSQGAWARATVASALTDFADRVRSNPAATPTAYLQATANYATQQGSGYVTSSSIVDCSDASAACSGADLAAYQLEQWRLSVKRSLPSSAIWVSGSRSTGYEATILWFDKSFVQSDGTLDTATACDPSITNVVAQRSCCPSGAVGATGVPGVRCTNMTVVP